MATEVIMPRLGLTMTEGTIIEWLKKEGDAVKSGERLLVVETDKVALDVESQVEGILLKIAAPAGSTVPLGNVIAYIGAEGEEIPTRTTPAVTQDAAPASLTLVQAKPAAQDEPLRVSPIAKKLAGLHNLDLKTIQGTGPQGRIVEADIYRTLEQPGTAGAALPGAAEAPSHMLALNNVRRTAARRMRESFSSAPHFYLGVEINAAALSALRDRLLPGFEHDLNLRLTYTDLILFALGSTLPQHPMLNAAFAGEGQVRVYETVNLGVAVTTELGLVVPVLRAVEKRTLAEIVRMRAALVKMAREQLLTAEELAGGTFTMTNLGMYGIDDFLPILNPPQSAILAVGAVVERPVGEAGQIVLRPTMRLTLAVDHRVTDGAGAAEFLQSLRQALEKSEFII